MSYQIWYLALFVKPVKSLSPEMSTMRYSAVAGIAAAFAAECQRAECALLEREKTMQLGRILQFYAPFSAAGGAW
jgi:hypothetical protein